MRQCIERAFDIMVQRWGILWRPIRNDFRHWSKLLLAVATLHNFCIDVGDAPIRTRADRDIREGDSDLILTNYNDAQTARIEGRTRRNELKQAVERAGVERPSTNLNSRA